MARILSCIQPTGDVQLGNYFGAIRRWVEDQTPESFHGIVDLHALTVPRDPAEMRAKTLELAHKDGETTPASARRNSITRHADETRNMRRGKFRFANKCYRT